MMHPSNSLRAVLTVRHWKEQAEERSLVALAQQMQQVSMEAERLRAELASLAASRLEEVQSLLHGTDHQRNEACYRQLQQQLSISLSQIKKLAQSHAEQRRVYLAARCDREVIGELEKRRFSAYRNELRMREQKRNDDLFLARRGWN